MVHILLSMDQMRNVHMTIEHTPQYNKITCQAFGMYKQPVPISSSGHTMSDLAAFCKKHEITTAAVDDDTTKPLAQPSLLAAASPSKTSEKKTATKAPAEDGTEIIGDLNNDHWIIDRTTNELHRVHKCKRRALHAPDTGKTCPNPLTQIRNTRITKKKATQDSNNKDSTRVVDRFNDIQIF